MKTKCVQEAFHAVHEHKHTHGNTPEAWPQNNTKNDSCPHFICSEAIEEDHFDEYFSKLSVCQRKSPKSEVRCSVWNSSQNKFNSFNHLMNKCFTETMAMVFHTHWLNLHLQGFHLILSFGKNFFSISVGISGTWRAITSTWSLDCWLEWLTHVISSIDVWEFNFLWFVMWVTATSEENWFNQKHEWSTDNNAD